MGTRRVLVTGCSSGIGLAIAVRLAKDELRRFKVVATMRDVEKRGALEIAAGETLSRTLEIRQLDACCESSIRECVNSLPERRVDVLVNNAGMGMIGPLECQSVKDMQDLFNTNFFGLVRLVKEVLPDMKRSQSGHIVVMSSVMGVQGLLFNDVYAASKFAVEGFCESLAVQAMKFNIKMSLVEPGPVVTEFEKKVYEEVQNMDLSCTDEETARIFREIYLPYSRKVFSSLGQTPEEVAEQTLQLIVAKNPPFRHQTNRLYTPLTAMKHADPTGRLPIDAFYKMVFQHDRVFNASLGVMRMLQKRMGKSKA
ncbi:retinol dehydrogenase 8 [Pygocentrus nattereri]|uniref:NADP-retinol dehydrogenase n=1 Tax=Pygocentrus nattereri TaxID=42514 RepID=A0A3B4CHA3_PYGNA|nr:retinol dehydrogenase 8 [Pygocentrus nattereri]XP_017557036.1 retinol dehydrogenase 8 [Pygocentrus nattereri]XP_017557038.1 retinol dehydrogenase 8 [Pygocentrus nattereri]XP_037394716.1 retinol dehydrogenase 8 [Pygocentrus nattereri]